MIRAHSGRPLEELTLKRVLARELEPDDTRISASQLEHQADVAERHGRPQLAGNLRRAAELTRFSDAEILTFYEALRPRRSTADELAGLAEHLRARGAARCAELVDEAGGTYRRRGLLA